MREENKLSNLIILYHRTPFDEHINSKGEREWVDQKSPNGIIPTLRNLFVHNPNGTWIAWRESDRSEVEKILMQKPTKFLLKRIPLTKKQIYSFYHVTSKECLWPILHTFPTFFDVNNADWETFKEVNKQFANAACNEAAKGATIWIHDYNLWMAPMFIRSKRKDVKIAFFHHTPFPGNDVFAILPWRKEIIESLLDCDLVGFHIPRYAENFARAANCLVGAKRGPKVEVNDRFTDIGSALTEPDVTPWLTYKGRTIKLLSSPVGTSPKTINSILEQPNVQKMCGQIQQDVKKGRKLILSASRVDYTKGNEELLLAYERLLTNRKDLRGKVVLMLACVSAASGMAIYEDTQRSIEEIVGRINGKYGQLNWVPIRLSTKRIPYEEMIAWYSQADICWITPLRDGLNLVAKEFICAKKNNPGTIVLSEFTGASVLLNGAILTNPYSHKNMDNAIEEALSISEDDQSKNMKLNSKAVTSYTVDDWAKEQLDSVAN